MAKLTMLREAKERTRLFDEALRLKAEHGIGSGRALRWARYEAKPVPEYVQTYSHDGWDVVTLEEPIDGFDIEIRRHYDELDTPDWIGTFTNQWDENAIELHDGTDGRTYRYFLPMQTETERRDWYHKAGMARGPAAERARRETMADIETARGYTSYVVSVTASRGGETIGTETVSGVDFHDEYDVDEFVRWAIGDGIVSEATYDAEQNLEATIRKHEERASDLRELAALNS